MKHRFQKGNKAALGHDGRKNRDPLSQVLISQLNGIDRNTGAEKRHTIVANLMRAAMGWSEKRNGKTIIHEPEAWAIREVFDRAEGRPAQALTVDAKEGATNIALIERVIVYPAGAPESETIDSGDYKVVRSGRTN